MTTVLDTLLSGPLAFVDTETLGLDPDVHPIWEVGLIVDGKEHSWLVKLTARALSLADPQALDVSHFYARYDAAAALPADEVCRRVRDLTMGRHLVGAVVSFDEERLRRLMWRNELTPGWHYHCIDVEALAVGCLAERSRWLAAGPGTLPDQARTLAAKAVPPWSSMDLSRLLGIDPDSYDRHTALGDARWAKALYEAVVPGRMPSASEPVKPCTTDGDHDWVSDGTRSWCTRCGMDNPNPVAMG